MAQVCSPVPWSDTRSGAWIQVCVCLLGRRGMDDNGWWEHFYSFPQPVHSFLFSFFCFHSHSMPCSSLLFCLFHRHPCPQALCLHSEHFHLWLREAWSLRCIYVNTKAGPMKRLWRWLPRRGTRPVGRHYVSYSHGSETLTQQISKQCDCVLRLCLLVSITAIIHLPPPTPSYVSSLLATIVSVKNHCFLEIIAVCDPL